MGAFQDNLQRAPKFLLILTALFGHQPTYKNLRGNTAPDQITSVCFRWPGVFFSVLASISSAINSVPPNKSIYLHRGYQVFGTLCFELQRQICHAFSRSGETRYQKGSRSIGVDFVQPFIQRGVQFSRMLAPRLKELAKGNHSTNFLDISLKQ